MPSSAAAISARSRLASSVELGAHLGELGRGPGRSSARTASRPGSPWREPSRGGLGGRGLRGRLRGAAFAGAAFGQPWRRSLGRGSLGRRSLGRRSLGRRGLRRAALAGAALVAAGAFVAGGLAGGLGAASCAVALRAPPWPGAFLAAGAFDAGRVGALAGPPVAVVAAAPRAVVFLAEVVPAAGLAVVRVVAGAFFAGALAAVFVAAFVAGAAALAGFLVVAATPRGGVFLRCGLRGTASRPWRRAFLRCRLALGLAVDAAGRRLRGRRRQCLGGGPAAREAAGRTARTPWRRRTAHGAAVLRPPGRCRPWCWPPHEIRSYPVVRPDPRPGSTDDQGHGSSRHHRSGPRPRATHHAVTVTSASRRGTVAPSGTRRPGRPGAHSPSPACGAVRLAAVREGVDGTSSPARSHERPGDGASPGACAGRRSPRSRRKNRRQQRPAE